MQVHYTLQTLVVDYDSNQYEALPVAVALLLSDPFGAYFVDGYFPIHGFLTRYSCLALSSEWGNGLWRRLLGVI